MITEQNIRLIFGLKLRQLRQKKGVTPKNLSKKSGISISYLNEIEKGKKYPKAEKIVAISNALEVPFDELVSLKLEKNLAPLADLLESNILRDLPLDLFGIGIENLVQMVSDAPAKVSAFISTLIDISRNYEMKVEHFYMTALRSYQQMHDNYFEDIELLVEQFIEKYEVDVRPPIQGKQLGNILKKEYQYVIDEVSLGKYPDLRSVRSLFAKKGKKNRILINDNLNDIQKAFQLGKELGYQFMALKDRNIGPSWVKIGSFDQVLNNFKASYFAGALLINRQPIIKDMEQLFAAKTWNGDQFLAVMNRYNASPETFLHRLTSIFPRYFGLKQLFFLRFHNNKETPKYDITKELHLPKQHNPHGNEINEHYCRRWISINIIKELIEAQAQKSDNANGPIVRVQRSHYINSGTEYFCISVARALYPTPDINSSVTIGFLMNKEFKNKVRFWNDPAIPVRMVNETCERCPMTDCLERSTPATVLQRQAEVDRIEGIVEQLIADVS